MELTEIQKGDKIRAMSAMGAAHWYTVLAVGSKYVRAERHIDKHVVNVLPQYIMTRERIEA